MSFDIFLMAAPGERFDRSIVVRAFEQMRVGDPADDEWGLQYADGSQSLATVSIDPEPQIELFSVNRPPGPGAMEFWDAMFEVLRQTRSFVVWPATGDPGYCVADPNWASYLLPEDFEHMGPPALVSSGRELYDVVDAHS